MSFTYKGYTHLLFSLIHMEPKDFGITYSAVNSGTRFYNAYNYLLENGYVFTRDPMAGIPGLVLATQGWSLLIHTFLMHHLSGSMH